MQKQTAKTGFAKAFRNKNHPDDKKKWRAPLEKMTGVSLKNAGNALEKHSFTRCLMIKMNPKKRHYLSIRQHTSRKNTL